MLHTWTLDHQREKKQTEELENSWIKRENSDSVANSINLRFTADSKRIQGCNVYLLKRNYLLFIPTPLPSTYKGKSVMTLPRFQEKSTTLLLKEVTYLRSVLAQESKHIWLLDKVWASSAEPHPTFQYRHAAIANHWWANSSRPRTEWSLITLPHKHTEG